MQCSSCGAGLPADTTICPYCQTRNFIDLQGVAEFVVHDREGRLPCPACQTPLQSLQLATSPSCSVDRCPECGGLFFPPGGVAFLLDVTVKAVYVANQALLDHLQRTGYHAEKVVYRHCPVCAQGMNRHNFGFRSGVVLDRCKAHGDWLDGGEFRHLAEWKKAGGMLEAK